MLRVVADDGARAELTLGLDEICREGARRMLAAALEAEADAYVESLVDEVGGDGRRLVVRNGHARPRPVATGAGPIEIEAPRVNDKRADEATGQRCRFRSSIVPPWARKSPKVAEVLPLMYLHGMSSGDFACWAPRCLRMARTPKVGTGVAHDRTTEVAGTRGKATSNE
jgi:transposase-like protein